MAGSSNEGKLRFAGDVELVVNPPDLDLSDMSIVSTGTVVMIRAAIPADGGEGDLRVALRITSMVTYGPDARSASGTVDIPASELEGVQREIAKVLKKYRAASQAQAQMNGASGLAVARQKGEYANVQG